MGTKYHIGDAFKIPKKNAIAIVVRAERNVNLVHPEDKYSLVFLEMDTHEPYKKHLDLKMAWWTNEEIEKTFKALKIFKQK